MTRFHIFLLSLCAFSLSACTDTYTNTLSVTVDGKKYLVIETITEDTIRNEVWSRHKTVYINDKPYPCKDDEPCEEVVRRVLLETQGAHRPRTVTGTTGTSTTATGAPPKFDGAD